MDFIHYIEEREGGLYLTHGVQIKGLSSFLFSRIIGKRIIQELPKAMANLSLMAEGK